MRADLLNDLLNSGNFLGCWPAGASQISCGSVKFSPTKAMEPYGGFRFRNQGFQFYKHPPAEAYGLNRLLFEVRHSDDKALFSEEPP